MSVTKHPRIVELRGIYDSPDTLFIVMDLLEGGELYDEIIRREVFTEKEASYVLKQLLEALAYLHDKGFVHRDLKLKTCCLFQKILWTSKLPILAFPATSTQALVPTPLVVPHFMLLQTFCWPTIPSDMALKLTCGLSV